MNMKSNDGTWLPNYEEELSKNEMTQVFNKVDQYW